MNILDDLINQLFSQVLIGGNDSNGLTYDKQTYPYASGFSFENQFLLDGSIGLLGLRHPLMIKANLQGALSPFTMADPSEVSSLYCDIEDFLSHLLGNVFINSTESINRFAFAPGRFVHFLNENDREVLKSNDLNLAGIFTFDFSLSSKKKNQKISNTMSVTDLIYNRSVLRLLKDGQLYDKAQLVKKRTDDLKQIFNGLKNISIDGLTVHISSLNIPSNIVSHENTLIYPLYFKEEDSHMIATLIKEKTCSS